MFCSERRQLNMIADLHNFQRIDFATYNSVDTGLNLMDEYETLMLNVFEKKGAVDQGINIVQWLRTTDFYSAPASTQFHEAYAGGLVHHTLKVVAEIIELCKLPKFASVDITSAVLAALCHDWCKINMYEAYQRNVKNDEGKWEQVTAYRRNPQGVPLGHGTTSMFLLTRFSNKVTTDEALAIRWHMGRWYACDSELNELQSANENCPLVHLLQFADQLAITSY